MPDYNPDREGHVEHEWIVQNATTQPVTGLNLDGKKMLFDRYGRMRVRDPGIANALRGDPDLVVSRARRYSPADRGHRYHFGQMPALPWARYDEMGRRIFDGKEDENPQKKQDGHDDAPGRDDAGRTGGETSTQEAEGGA